MRKARAAINELLPDPLAPIIAVRFPASAAPRTEIEQNLTSFDQMNIYFTANEFDYRTKINEILHTVID